MSVQVFSFLRDLMIKSRMSRNGCTNKAYSKQSSSLEWSNSRSRPLGRNEEQLLHVLLSLDPYNIEINKLLQLTFF